MKNQENNMERKEEFLNIIRQDQELMSILKIAEKAHLPNWYIGAGIVRNSVWDYLHNKTEKTPIRDIDLVYFSDEEINEDKARKYLEENLPQVEWDFKNSKHVHEWYKKKKGLSREPLNSSEEDIDNWPETSTCIGLRLSGKDILIYAPYGIDDLMDMIFRRNKTGDGITEEVFNWRVEHKKIAERWPKAKIIYG